MVSQTARYALRLLGFLASRRDRLTTAEEIAGATGVPANYLAKILNQLRKHGLVESRKGWGGGFRMRRRALKRPIRDVLAILDGADSIERSDCVFGLPKCNDDRPCPLHGYWEEIRETFTRMLTEMRVGDLAEAE